MQLFTIAGIPVRATLGFLMIVAYYGYQFSDAGIAVAAGLVIGGTLSVLIHEFGHGLVARHYKLEPSIELHFWGGLCRHQIARKNGDDVRIIVAGPLLQLAAGLVVWAVTRVVVPSSPFAAMFTLSFLYVSIIWGALNLFLPIWPLDGGQLFRMIMIRFMKPIAKAERIVHIVGIATSVVVAVLGFAVLDTPLLGILGVMWIMENARGLSSGTRAPMRVRSALADMLLGEANDAAAHGDWREARRLAFQAREEKTVTDDQVERVFEILTVASAELGEWHEALSWWPRAPRNAATLAAKVKSLSGLGRRDQARAELDASDAPRLDDATRARLLALIEA